ncbi:MAG: hypothetical protein ACE5OR_16985, partial [bacterium]
MIKSINGQKWRLGFWAILILVWNMVPTEACAFPGGSNARSGGLAGAYTALSRGVDAALWNPANLGLASPHRFSLNLVSAAVGLSNNSFSKSQYDLYNGAFWDSTRQEAILASIPSGGLKLNLDSEIQVLGFSYGPFAFTATGNIASDLVMARDSF